MLEIIAHVICSFVSLSESITKYVVIIFIVVIVTTTDTRGSQKVKSRVLYFMLFTKLVYENFTVLHYKIAQGMAIFSVCSIFFWRSSSIFEQRMCSCPVKFAVLPGTQLFVVFVVCCHWYFALFACICKNKQIQIMVQGQDYKVDMAALSVQNVAGLCGVHTCVQLSILMVEQHFTWELHSFGLLWSEQC